MKQAQPPVRTRMAPSPTGEMHVGGMAMVLKNYAWAHRHGGQFVLRIEDTDKQREVAGGVEQIQNIIKAYGLSWDEGPGVGGPYAPYIQSQRLELYQKMAHLLVDKGKAYYCVCSKERLVKLREEAFKNKMAPKYDRRCLSNQAQVVAEVKKGQPYVIRLRVPDSDQVTFHDELRGDITVQTNQVDDQVLLKSDGFPTYHLAVVVDDHEMKITHILRGEEWLSSTPKHIWLYQAFGWDGPGELPKFIHIPVFLNPNGKGKMSKRHGTVSAQAFLDEGYLPEALLNFFMILGWAHPQQKEILTLDEYVQVFDPSDMSKNSVAFDLKKLDWLNGQYIRKLSQAELQAKIQPFLPADFPKKQLAEILPLVSQRLVKLSQVEELTEFFYRVFSPPWDELVKRSTADEVAQQLEITITSLKAVSDWSHDQLEQALRNLQIKHDWSKKQYFMMLRLAVTGKSATPPLFETMAVLGRDLVLERLNQARSALSKT